MSSVREAEEVLEAALLEPPTKLSRSTTAMAEEEVERTRSTRTVEGWFLTSPPHSIRTRLWKLNIDNSDGAEVFAVGRAIAQKRQDIQDCEKAIQFHQDRLESLHEELRDFRTWRGPT